MVGGLVSPVMSQVKGREDMTLSCALGGSGYILEKNSH